ncbi:mRNA surveillance protein pelota [Fervidicoccus fontis]|uniref:Protein pelota homolog n=1 Tax=Fervidicoccus fontis (strain DSM 19380 / JCM 18336 / VKM B-2539 / Kam940) TaxID=1163730 RepID=I0A1Y6_FERFK|nr:mRNA surveillance protein pelota [Fervidicoccus fontis]AFH42993.1 pelota-like protein [Fervidicoccus fontis Kam940]
MKYEFIDNKKTVLKIKIENIDDLWLLYTILQKGDLITMKTLRDVKQSEGGKSRRLPMTLTISLSHMEFQPFTNKLRIRGIVKEGPDKFGILGSHHTLSVGEGDELIVFREEGWDQSTIKRMEKYKKSFGSVLIVAVDYDEYSIALFRRQGYKILVSNDLHIPGKGDESREKAITEAINEIASLVLSIINREKDIFGIVISGPGFFKEVVSEAIKNSINKLTIVLENTSMGGVYGIKETIAKGKPTEILKDEELKKSLQLLENILIKLSVKPEQVAIGLEECKNASEIGAVSDILILDELLSNQDLERRKEIEEVLNNVESFGGRVVILPSCSEASEKLYGLGSIVCLLRFPISTNKADFSSSTKNEGLSSSRE